MDPLLEKIGRYLIGKEQTISIAESVTAGCLQTAFSNIKDAKEFFQGGITVYNSGQKARHLAIDPIFAGKCDAVDIAIAKKMALEVCNEFCSNLGIGTTGYAAPMPELEIEQPFAYFAIAAEGKVLVAEKIKAESKDYGLGVQKEYVKKIIEALAGILL